MVARPRKGVEKYIYLGGINHLRLYNHLAKFGNSSESGLTMKIKVGFGFDVHQLRDDHPFILGGVQIAHYAGAFGHSDADVLVHAICDAILGAANLEDIGYHFPNTDDRWKGVNSLVLLTACVKLLNDKGWSLGNIDSMLCLEAPKIKPYIPAMRSRIASAAGISEEDVSIKATTNETMGFIGRQEGVVAYAVCLIEKK